jgi:hypothetical protein
MWLGPGRHRGDLPAPLQQVVVGLGVEPDVLGDADVRASRRSVSGDGGAPASTISLIRGDGRPITRTDRCWVRLAGSMKAANRMGQIAGGDGLSATICLTHSA